MARLPNGWSRMLCALLQFGSDVSAVKRPSPPIARTRRNGPRTVLSKRFSSLSSSTRSWPETMTSGAPIMSSQKIGPSSLVRRARFCTGAVESRDSMLPTTGLVGGCGIGLNLFFDAIVKMPFASPKSPPPPFDQLGADFLRLLLLGPVSAAAHEIFFQIGHDLFHAVSRRRRQHRVVLRHDHQRRHPNRVIESFRALPVSGPVAIPVDAAGEASLRERIDKDLLFFRRQDRLARVVF